MCGGEGHWMAIGCKTQLASMDAICKCNTVLHRCFDVRPLGTNSLDISAEHSLLKKGQIKKKYVYYLIRLFCSLYRKASIAHYSRKAVSIDFPFISKLHEPHLAAQFIDYSTCGRGF